MNPPSPESDQTVYVVDDDEALRDSLLWMLDANGFRAEGFESAEAFLAAYTPAMTGCLVLDVRMPGMSGLELFDRLRTLHVTLPVIFITGHGDVPMAVATLKRGAHDFIEKPFGDKAMQALIEQCLAQERESRDRVRQEAAIARRLEQLTSRERDVLDLIIAGRLNKQIAGDLSISIKTVEVHRARVMEKMGASSLAELVQAVAAQDAPWRG
ncbi:MAG: response regulator transcription factor [Rhodocyclaceae bacterium]|nr:response regulator transcription factor [Rhodocyclaceae bacterium]